MGLLIELDFVEIEATEDWPNEIPVMVWLELDEGESHFHIENFWTRQQWTKETSRKRLFARLPARRDSLRPYLR
jgi:hypothetical protein